MRVLVIDDNDDVRAAIRSLLMKAGHEPYLAVDATAAFEICKSTTPEFVLIDITLPGDDGYSVAKKLRDQCGLTNVQMWALSAYPDDPVRRRDSGVVGHIQKPLTYAHIQALIGVTKPPA